MAAGPPPLTNMEESQKELEASRKSGAALISVGINVFLALFKVLLAILSGSLAILADAYHSGSDIFVSLLVYLGVKIPKKGTVRVRIENIVSVTISLFILYAAYTVFVTAIKGQQIEIKFLPIAIIGTFLSITVSYFLARYKIYVGEATNSPSLIADGQHSRADMYSSIVVLVALIGYLIGVQIDRFAAMIVAIFIAFTGIEILYGGIKALVSGKAVKFILPEYGRIPALCKLRSFGERIVSKKWLILRIGITCILLGYLLTGLYIVKPGEQAIIRRFGKITAYKTASGIYYHLPYPFEKIKKISTASIRRVEVGFRTRKQIVKEPEAYVWEIRHIIGRYEKRYEESLMLTGDHNVVDMSTVVQYRIKDMVKYLFKTDSPTTLLRAATESVIRRIVAEEKVDILLSKDRAPLEVKIKSALQDLLDKYDMGIEVVNVGIQELHPPIEVVPAFRAVAAACEDKERYINEAESYYNKVISRARADAERIIREAEAYKIASINRAHGEAKRFRNLLTRYKEAPSVTTTRYYLETMERTLPKVNKFIFTPGAPGGILDLRSYIGGALESILKGRVE